MECALVNTQFWVLHKDNSLYKVEVQEVMDDFKVRLKEVRTKRGYTQGQLASEINCSMKTIANWEQGIYTPYNFFVLCELARQLEVTPEFLVNGETDMKLYTDTIKKELKQLNYNQIIEIKKQPLNKIILSRLELSDDLVCDIKLHWNNNNIFVLKKENGAIEKHRCNRNFASDVIIKYCQNRQKFRKEFQMYDG